jgi:hypothetical protein
MSYRAHIAVALMTAAVVVALSVPASASQVVSQASTTTVPGGIGTDRTTAQKINLTAADLPGWKESPNPPNTSGSSFDAQLAKCTGNPAYKYNDDVVDVTSANFSKGPIALSSDVQMVRSHADGLSDIKLTTDPKILGCFDTISKREFSEGLPPGAKVSDITSSLFKPTEAIPLSFGLHAAITVEIKKDGITETDKFVVNEVDFLVGRAEVGLDEFVTGKPVPVTNEAALLHILDTRAISGTAGVGS